MSIKRTGYKTYTKEFKLEAFRLMSLSDKPLAENAAELSIRRNMLYNGKSSSNLKVMQRSPSGQDDNLEKIKVKYAFVREQRPIIH
jgi:transposase-like protein